MSSKYITIVALCLGTLSLAFSQAVDTELRQELEALLPSSHAGVAVGILHKEEERIHFIGNEAFSETTLFEFGSITKVFTALVLQRLINEGTLTLEESINPYLPENVQNAKWNDVTFKRLATHSSGLPPLPPNMGLWYLIFNSENVYAAYGKEQLWKGLRRVRINDDTSYNYSNLGFGLLGTLLSEITGYPYDTLVHSYIFEVLAMDSATVTGWSGDDIAPALTEDGEETSVWDFDALAAAGAVRGSIRDGMKFLAASMTACEATETVDVAALARANCQAQQATKVRVAVDMVQGLGWLRYEGQTGDIIWHNGGTGGFSTFLGFNAVQDVGIVLLANVGDADVTDVGLRFLEANHVGQRN